MTLDEAIEWGKRGELCDLMTEDDQRQVAEWLRQVRWADAAVRWYMAKLRELEAENATLRQQLADVTESMGRVEERCAKLREQNAKLRLLATAMQVYGSMDTDVDLLRALEIRDAIKRLSDELGVEVTS